MPVINSSCLLQTTAMSVFATYAVYFRTQRGRKPVGDVTSLVAPLNALRQIVSFGCAYFAMAGPELAVAVCGGCSGALDRNAASRCDEHLLGLGKCGGLPMRSGIQNAGSRARSVAASRAVDAASVVAPSVVGGPSLRKGIF